MLQLRLDATAQLSPPTVNVTDPNPVRSLTMPKFVEMDPTVTLARLIHEGSGSVVASVA